MEDTEAAIFRLFEAFPQVDVIDIRVLGPTAESLMFAGKVCRADLDTSHSMRSVRMRLRRLAARGKSRQEALFVENILP
jgi:hypothetical protein